MDVVNQPSSLHWIRSHDAVFWKRLRWPLRYPYCKVYINIYILLFLIITWYAWNVSFFRINVFIRCHFVENAVITEIRYPWELTNKMVYITCYSHVRTNSNTSVVVYLLISRNICPISSCNNVGLITHYITLLITLHIRHKLRNLNYKTTCLNEEKVLAPYVPSQV